MSKIQTITRTIDLIIQEIENYEIWDAEKECVVGHLDEPVLKVEGKIKSHGKNSMLGPLIIKNRDDLEEVIAQSLRALNKVESKGHAPSRAVL